MVGRTVRVFCFSGSVLAGTVRLTGGGGGTVRISSFSGSVLGGTVRWKWWGGGAVFHSHVSQFAVSSLGGWICAVGILRFYPLWYL